MEITNKKYWLEQLMEMEPDKIGFVDKDNQFTYLQIWKFVKEFARSLSNKGIEKNNHVAILSNNSIEFIIVINALWLLGCVPVPLNVRLKINEINKLIEHSQSKAVVNIKTDFNLNKINCANKINYSVEKITGEVNKLHKVEFDKNRSALLMYSSGSTGKPKCVEHSFGNLFESVKAFQKYMEPAEEDIWLASLPFYHIGGFSIITRSLLSKNKIVIPPSFAVKDLIKTFMQEKPSYFSVVSTTMQRLLECRMKKWKSLKAVFLGGGPIPEKLITACLNNNYPIVKVYGSTETASMVTAISAVELKHKPLSVGKALPDVKINIIENSNTSLAKNKTGEIVVEASFIAKKYFNSDKVTNGKIKSKKYFTNDLGYIDEENYLFVQGRKDDVIISGGENIALTEIEQFTQTIDFIDDCATLKITDKTWGESYLLFVSLRKDENETEKFILTKLQERFAGYKLPKRIYVVSTIPRNQLGKIKKQELKKLLS